MLVYSLYCSARAVYTMCAKGMDARQYRRFIEEHRRLGKPEDCPVTVYGIMLHCWAHELVTDEFITT